MSLIPGNGLPLLVSRIGQRQGHRFQRSVTPYGQTEVYFGPLAPIAGRFDDVEVKVYPSLGGKFFQESGYLWLSQVVLGCKPDPETIGKLTPVILSTSLMSIRAGSPNYPVDARQNVFIGLIALTIQ